MLYGRYGKKKDKKKQLMGQKSLPITCFLGAMVRKNRKKQLMGQIQQHQIYKATSKLCITRADSRILSL